MLGFGAHVIARIRSRSKVQILHEKWVRTLLSLLLLTDSDTLPIRSTIRKKLKQIHALSLRLIANRLVEGKSEGSLLTHARKHVGSFTPAGVHVNRDEYLPLPTLNISSETTINIAYGIQTDFELLATAPEKSSDDLYGNIDLHMTDGTAHNKC